MPKIVQCTIKGFEGSVTFCQPLFLEQVIAFEDAQDAATEIEPSTLLTKLNEIRGLKTESGEIVRGIWSSRADKFFIPVLLKCVEKIQITGLENVTLETFPLTPRKTSQEFIDFLFDNVMTIYNGEVDIPNES